jgi:hypothetical protein
MHRDPLSKPVLALFLLLALVLSSCASSSWYTPYGINNDAELASPAAVSKLIRALESGDEKVQRKAMEALEALGPEAKPAVPYLVDLLSSENWKFVYYDIHAILKIDPSNEAVSQGIEALLLHVHPRVRVLALTTIQESGYYHPDLVEVVKEIASDDPHRKVKVVADRTWRKLKIKEKKFNLERKSVATSQRRDRRAVVLPKDAVYEIPKFYSTPKEEDLAVIIGIERYQNIARKSDYSYNDALLVKQYLKALGFQERNIEFLANERATTAGIRKAIEAWLPNNATKGSKVFMYYSGHGAPDTNGKGYIVPYDGDPNYLEFTGYPLDRLYATLAKLDSDEVMVVIDSCFSGAGGRSVLPTGARPIFMEVKNPILKSDNVAVLSSARMDQISTSYSEKQLGLFTYYFLNALKDNKMTFVEIYDQIKPRVEDEAKRVNIEQSPTLLMHTSAPHNKFSLR